MELESPFFFLAFICREEILIVPCEPLVITVNNEMSLSPQRRQSVDPEGIDSSSGPRCAAVAGFSLHANVCISPRDRLRLERLCRYVARPPLSMDRLEALPDARLRYWFKTPWRDGTTHAVFEPLQFIEKLCALVPTPHAHTVRYHGILGPAAKWRPLLVPNNAVTFSKM